METEIKRMTPEDAPNAAALEEKCFPFPWSDGAIRDELDNGSAAFFSAFSDGKFVGHAGMITALGEGNVCNIAVDPSARRRGVGEALVKALIAEGKARYLNVIMLEVRASNAPAIALYKKLGFIEVGRRKNFYSRPREDGLLFNYYCKKDKTE